MTSSALSAVAKILAICAPCVISGIVWDVYREDLSLWFATGQWECVGYAGTLIAAAVVYLVDTKARMPAQD